jgi:Bacterial Ig-like domain (group 3)/Glycosyl Hydrolase Family 88/Fibronectin type III domain
MKARELSPAATMSLAVLLVIAILMFSSLAEAQSTGCTDSALALAEGQLTDTIAYTSTVQFPVQTNPANGNKWTLTDANWWTSGFFPGWIWYMYEKDLNSAWLTRAEAQTSAMQSQQTNASDHDIGFKILGSYGNAYRITRDPAYMKAIQTAANAMTTLYRPTAGVIESWPNYDSRITVIIDNMMNLELLFFAAQNGGNPNWRTMAISHAVKTMENHVRADGSTYHVVDYNNDGTVFSKFTVQGAGNETTWARGQAWAIYGFTVTYRYTKDLRFLATAQKLADYFISHLPPDYIPYWDFSKCCTAPRDSSAAAIAAAGLLELSTYMSTTADQAKYRNAALNIQTSLSSPAYLGTRAGTDGVLLHGSANVPANSGVDISLVYGDYYFIQGCFRARSVPAAPTGLAAVPGSDTTVNLDWTAESGPIRYSVKRSTAATGPYKIVAPPPILTTNRFEDTGLIPGATYHYVVSAINASGESPNSAAVAVTTPKAATSTSLTSSANPSVYGHAVTFTATVKPTVAGTPTGTVTFRNGTSTLGTASLSAGKAIFTTASLAAGSYAITAVYGGNAEYTGSTSPTLTQTVAKAGTSTTVTSSLNPSRHGNSVTFTATVKSLTIGTPTGSVTFWNGATSLGTVTLTSGKATFTTAGLTVGSHSINVVYHGAPNYRGSTSPALTQTVNP